MSQRGRLRVYLGAAPGVGKTVAMLNEGRRLRGEGRDIVIGLVEAHGRADTIAAIGDLEVVPKRQVMHRGVALEEMDVEAILLRNPEIALIDELAHTNAPGSPRIKRWDDVSALLDAGINVIATLNVQHLESMHDVVESITGVRVNETVPDAVLDQADVQLIDLPVETLIERLERGKIYPEATARRALDGFFRAGNLNALRELSLRRMAAGVDEHLDRYMRDHQIETVWPAAERVLVALDGGPAMEKTLRRAWKLASGAHGELIAVVLTPSGGRLALPPEDRTSLERMTRLAEDLGASVRAMDGDDSAAILAEAAKAENASVIAIAYSSRAGLRNRLKESPIDRLLRLTHNVDIFIVEY